MKIERSTSAGWIGSKKSGKNSLNRSLGEGRPNDAYFFTCVARQMTSIGVMPQRGLGVTNTI